MMEYVVINEPISLRPDPDPSVPIINAYPPNTLVTIYKEDNGWLQTEDGKWILKTENIITRKEWDKLNPSKETNQSNAIKDINALAVSMAASNIVHANDNIKLTGSNMQDPVTGNTIDSSYSQGEGTILMVTGVEEDGSIAVSDSATGQNFHVSPESVQVQDKESMKWTDVSASAMVAEIQKNSIISRAGEITGIKDMIANIEELNVTSTRSIFGMPYQFTPIADNRLDGSFNPKSFGRKYAQKIVTRMPVLILQAGVPEFLSGWSTKDQKSIISALGDQLGVGEDNSDLQAMLNRTGKYYAFKATPKDYFDVVTPMCSAMANLLNIDSCQIDTSNGSQRIGDINWYQESQKSKWGYYAGSVSFYVNSEPQVNEAFNNSTTQSQLASKMNDIGRAGTELQFLMGGLATKNVPLAGTALKNTGTEAAAQHSQSNSGGIIDSMIGNIQTLLAGGRMAFPEIWSDSQFMRSYNVTIKLDSPDADTISLYWNILVPLAHILGMVSPRSLGYNNYVSPFLVRAYYKSMFHIDMGIITDCQIQKGDVGAWSQNGLPTQVTIQLTIKDLYDVMAVSLNKGTNDIIGNPAQLDYLANMCGINIGTPDIYRTWKLWCAVRGINRISNNISNAWTNLMFQCYRKWFNLWDSNWTM